MEPTISLKSNHANGSRAVIFHLIIILLALASCLPTCQSQQLISYNPRGGPVIVENDIFLLDSGASYSFILFGFSLTNDTILKWTQSEDACNENEALFGNTELVSVANENGGLIRATYDVSFPLVAARTNLYFCLRNNNDDFAHQSNDTLLKLIVIPTATELLPLPVNIIFILILMCLSGLFSGLNLGLMSLDPTTLKIIMKSGTKQQRRCAKIIQTVRRFGNYLLCTLLLGNVLVNSAFTILLDGVIGNGAYAVVGSTLAIVIFGEIIPQAICSRYGLFIGAYTIPLTYVFMALTFPLSFPISLILTLILGKEIGAVYNRQQLLELLSISRDVNQINDHELDILSGALQFKDKTVAQIMTKFEHVFCVDINSCLDFPTIKEIYDSGFSRIPIYENERDCIVGILHLRDLTFIDPEDYVPVRQLKDFYNRDPTFVYYETKLEDMLEQFVNKGEHMAIVYEVTENDDSDNNYEIIGIVTLEDIIEEIIGKEIVDEYDQIEDNITRKKRVRKHHIDVGKMYTTPVINLSSPQVLAVKQFLTTAVEPFQDEYITKTTLHRLLHQDIIFKVGVDQKDFLLYKPGVPANYFTLLLEGCLTVTIGDENMEFEARGFYHFGDKVLMDVVKNSLNSEPISDYIPQFKVSMNSECLVLIITRRRYEAAFKASRFERENNEPMLTDRSDIFTKEWEHAENSDLQATLTGSDGLTNIVQLLKTKPLQDLSSRTVSTSDSYQVNGHINVTTNHFRTSTMNTRESQV